jgi:hypothetical protein
MATILKISGDERISILKMDIEGAERVVFQHGYERWIDRVDAIVIELHGSVAAEIFFRAIHGRGFIVSHCDELTVCRRTT